jgi:hypothetical protein
MLIPGTFTTGVFATSVQRPSLGSELFPFEHGVEFQPNKNLYDDAPSASFISKTVANLFSHQRDTTRFPTANGGSTYKS